MENSTYSNFNSLLSKQLANGNLKQQTSYMACSTYPRSSKTVYNYNQNYNNINYNGSSEYNETNLIDENFKVKSALNKKNAEYHSLKSDYTALQNELDSCYKTIEEIISHAENVEEQTEDETEGKNNNNNNNTNTNTKNINEEVDKQKNIEHERRAKNEILLIQK